MRGGDNYPQLANYEYEHHLRFSIFDVLPCGQVRAATSAAAGCSRHSAVFEPRNLIRLKCHDFLFVCSFPKQNSDSGCSVGAKFDKSSATLSVTLSVVSQHAGWGSEAATADGTATAAGSPVGRTAYAHSPHTTTSDFAALGALLLGGGSS